MSTRIALIILSASALALITACAEINSIRSGIGMYGQQASDSALHDSVWAICKASPVGAIKRKFNTPEKMELYNSLCSNTELLSESE